MREREMRARRIVAYLKRTYPRPKSELKYRTPFQFVVAVIMSAQCTDKVVNRVTEPLFKKYKTPADFAKADPVQFTKEISSVTFFRNKTKSIIAAAGDVVEKHGGKVLRLFTVSLSNCTASGIRPRTSFWANYSMSGRVSRPTRTSSASRGGSTSPATLISRRYRRASRRSFRKRIGSTSITASSYTAAMSAPRVRTTVRSTRSPRFGPKPTPVGPKPASRNVYGCSIANTCRL